MPSEPSDIASIDALHAITFDESPRIVSALFSHDSSSVYVHLHTEVIDLWSLLVHFWPELGGVLVALLLVAMLWRIAHVRARPRRVGQWCCRRCNLELSEHVDDRGRPRQDETLCPECGRRITHRQLVRGRTVRRRVGSIVLLVVLVGCVYIAAFAAGVGRTNAASTWLFWPSRSLLEWSAANNT